MGDTEHKGQKPSYEDLAAENERLRRRVAELEALLEKLRAEVEEARCRQKRQVAPFSKGSPKANPKLSGRKPNNLWAHRPRPEQVDWVIEVPLPSEEECRSVANARVLVVDSAAMLHFRSEHICLSNTASSVHALSPPSRA